MPMTPELREWLNAGPRKVKEKNVNMKRPGRKDLRCQAHPTRQYIEIGEAHQCAKLTELHIHWIRRQRDDLGFKVKRIASYLTVSTDTVRNIHPGGEDDFRLGLTWRTVVKQDPYIKVWGDLDEVEDLPLGAPIRVTSARELAAEELSERSPKPITLNHQDW